jgi:hypothetical protein
MGWFNKLTDGVSKLSDAIDEAAIYVPIQRAKDEAERLERERMNHLREMAFLENRARDACARRGIDYDEEIIRIGAKYREIADRLKEQRK